MSLVLCPHSYSPKVQAKGTQTHLFIKWCVSPLERKGSKWQASSMGLQEAGIFNSIDIIPRHGNQTLQKPSSTPTPGKIFFPLQLCSLFNTWDYMIWMQRDQTFRQRKNYFWRSPDSNESLGTKSKIALISQHKRIISHYGESSFRESHED